MCVLLNIVLFTIISAPIVFRIWHILVDYITRNKTDFLLLIFWLQTRSEIDLYKQDLLSLHSGTTNGLYNHLDKNYLRRNKKKKQNKSALVESKIYGSKTREERGKISQFPFAVRLFEPTYLKLIFLESTKFSQFNLSEGGEERLAIFSGVFFLFLFPFFFCVFYFFSFLNASSYNHIGILLFS